MFTAAILENFYNVCSRFLPKSLRGLLVSIDSQLDTKSVKNSWQLFNYHEWEGVLAVIALLAIYVIVYFISLIT
jgi:hypothetical protein